MVTRILIAPMVFLLLSSSVYGQEAPKAVGKQACASCHASEQRTVAGTPHESGASCEGCHGPGERHVKSFGDGDIFSFRKASAFEVRERCGGCHNLPTMRRNSTGDVSCVNCHSAHHYVNKEHLLTPPQDLQDRPAQRHAEGSESPG